jgi:hypothetical protein
MPDHDVRLTWPEADALRSLVGCAVALLVPARPALVGSAAHVVLAGGPQPLHVLSVYVPTPRRDAPWLDVERPRIQHEWPGAMQDEPPTEPIEIGVVREVAVLTDRHVDDPVEHTTGPNNAAARCWRSIRRALRTDEQRIIDELVDDAEKQAARHPPVTVVDEAFELVADRVLYVSAVGSLIDWWLDAAPEGYTRHVLSPIPPIRPPSKSPRRA